MKWLFLILTPSSAIAFGSIFGFDAYMLIIGAVAGLVSSFAIAAYLDAVKRDDRDYGYSKESNLNHADYNNLI